MNLHSPLSGTSESSCVSPENHNGHLCVLCSQEKLENLRHLTDDHTVVCFICGRKANSEDNVCSPMPIR